MRRFAITTDTAFASPFMTGGEERAVRHLQRFFWPRPPYETVDELPLCEHFCVLAAARDPDAECWTVIDISGLGVIFEVDDPHQILAKADAILTDLIEVSGWPDRGWVIIADVYDSLEALRPWID